MPNNLGLGGIADKGRVALVTERLGFYTWAMMRILLIFAVLGLAGCNGLPLDFSRAADEVDPATLIEGQVRPRARPDALGAAKPDENAVTVEQFDTTTDEQRILAAEVPALGEEVSLGVTVASLGDPSQPGFWLETPLVDAGAKGRVYAEETGASAQVNLIPIDGPATGGSRISLSAMRLLGVPLTGLPELEVFRTN